MLVLLKQLDLGMNISRFNANVYRCTYIDRTDERLNDSDSPRPPRTRNERAWGQGRVVLLQSRLPEFVIVAQAEALALTAHHESNEV